MHAAGVNTARSEVQRESETIATNLVAINRGEINLRSLDFASATSSGYAGGNDADWNVAPAVILWSLLWLGGLRLLLGQRPRHAGGAK